MTKTGAAANWWEGFFSGLWMEVQRRLRTVEETHAEVDFIERTLRVKPGDRLLDIPCGVGRHTIELATRGYDVTGVDITKPFLEDARRDAARRNVAVRLEQRDMRTPDWVAEFDGACNMCGSFGYFEEKENADFLAGMARALRPGGRFVMDTHVTETLLARLTRERDWRRVGDTLVLEERSYDPASSRTHTEWIFVRNGQVSRHSTSVRLYSYRELIELLASAGFSGVETYGSLKLEPFDLSSPRLYLVAEKP